MAQNGETSPSFFQTDDPELSGPIHDILSTYSKIPDSEQAAHVKRVRDEAWKVFKYPCVGKYAFLRLSIRQARGYSTIVDRLRSGEKFLDVGCCFGQDIRALVYDGVPSENLVGTELQAEFVDLGSDLFRDRETLQARFVTEDFLTLTKNDLGGSFDIIHAAAFLHLFGLERQTRLMIKILDLLAGPGSMFFGYQLGALTARSHKARLLRSGECYWHNEESWRAMVQDVSEKTGKRLQTEFVQERTDLKWSLGTDIRFWFNVTIEE